MAILRTQFSTALSNIEVNGAKRLRAIAAHEEIQEFLASDAQLREWGVNTRLIGSYSRQTGIYPGKDVDVFGRLDNLNTTASPRDVYAAFERLLVGAYGHVDRGGRARPQDRSVKVDFSDPDDDPAGGFAVDAVPAVHDAERWGIPTKDRNQWSQSTGRWVVTDPERFGELATTLNSASPAVAAQFAYKPVVKLLRQARRVHLGERRPGGLYVEFAAYEVWNAAFVQVDEWDPLFAQTLRRVAQRFAEGPVRSLVDPGLGTNVNPPVSSDDYAHAAAEFDRLANLADAALAIDECQAAVKWREILGQNGRGQVFPLPPGCDANGFRIGAIAAVASTGLNEARRFG